MAGLKADHRAAKAAWSGKPDRCCTNMLPGRDSQAARGLGKPVDQRYDVEANQDRGQSNQARSLRGQKNTTEPLLDFERGVAWAKIK